MKDVTIGNQQRSLELRLSWLGGIIDGEGTVSVNSKYSKGSRQKTYHFRPEVDITNTDEKLLCEIESILNEIDVTYYTRIKKSQNANHNVAREIHIEGIKRLNKFLPIIIPYLIAKKEVAELVHLYIYHRLEANIKQPLTDYEEDIILKIRRLNHRGVLNRPTTIRWTPVSIG